MCAAAAGGADGGLPLVDAGPVDAGVPDDDAGSAGGVDAGRPDAGPPPMAANDVTVGGGFACARTYGHEVFCWGYNSNGQLGNPVMQINTVYDPTRVNGLSDVTAVAAADNHACALGSVSGDVGIYCWGDSSSGALGTAAGQAAGVPHRVNVDDSVHESAVDLQTGADSTCVLTSDDEVWCWGPGVPGYVVGSPLRINAFTGAVRLHVSSGAICAKLQTGVRCLDQSGVMRSLCSSGPGARECESLDDAADFQFTASNACRIDGADAVGKLWCAGENEFGVAAPELPADMAIDFAQLDDVLPSSTKQVALGDQHACALGVDATVRCWGRNLWFSTAQAEAFGDPCSVDALCHEPEAVAALPDITDLDAFRNFTCAVADDGALWCWGALGSDLRFGPYRYVIPED